MRMRYAVICILKNVEMILIFHLYADLCEIIFKKMDTVVVCFFESLKVNFTNN
jgi:hypothetical protein